MKQIQCSFDLKIIFLYLVVTLFSCQQNNAQNSVASSDFVASDFALAKDQYQLLLGSRDFPRTLDTAGRVVGTDEWDWTGGFFPGALWYIYEYTKDPEVKANATIWTEKLEKAKDLTQHHDIGFVMYCAYGNALRLETNPDKIKQYQQILVHSAQSALKRFDPKVGLIKSWNEKASWDGKTVWKYPVIIDNMMNLELLFFASELTGDPKYKHAAISHADHTLKNHFRSDYSTYHVVDYDPNTGAVAHQQTNQGYADNSTWSRGQGWAIYGYTLLYRETREDKYLEAAKKAADFYMNHPNLPKDRVPYWDFNAGQQGYRPDVDYSNRKLKVIPRDASAAALVSSALLELSTYTSGADAKRYFDFAEGTLKTLSSSEYLAKRGTNGGFILKHSVGSMPHQSEVDVPLIYADYYFLEALLRYRNLAKAL
ncbi:glycoside hydrolase family 88 protein [uncultured Sphingobacterium sp.]|uniref:glycoside hydrolase family 88 protein n=1 Tax=uncultured Sphingobacterium sp. TaxID=182688 RepID=UPI0025FB1D31|nr:glycoside hydrolase family 88 protein [uncultured Sphingobacterium sp.]